MWRHHGRTIPGLPPPKLNRFHVRILVVGCPDQHSINVNHVSGIALHNDLYYDFGDIPLLGLLRAGHLCASLLTYR
jgi:hypothetical protein